MVNSLIHYGVKGMKWGVRRTPEQLGHINNPKAKTGNLNLYGQKGHNALFVTGLSGSGKSTFAKELSKKIDAEVIHLDLYFERKGEGNNENFNAFLKENGVIKEKMFNDKGKLNYEVSDRILPLIKKYPNNVIVEGVQILDTTLSEHPRKFFKGEPMISLQTPKNLSVKRAMTRDGVSKDKINDMLQRAEETYKIKSDLEIELNLTIGKHYVEQLVRKKVS